MDIKCNYNGKPCPYPIDFDCSGCDVYKNATMKVANSCPDTIVPFSTEKEAQEVLSKLKKYACQYGKITRADILDLTGRLSNSTDHSYYILDSDVEQAEIKYHNENSEYWLIFHNTKFMDWNGNDPVNHPAHYTAGGIECIDAIAAALTSQNDPMAAWLTGQCLKYLWRWPLKNGLEDLKKTRFYLDRLIKYVEEK